MPSSAPAVKAALVDVLAALFPAPALATYGTPGSYQPDEIAAVLGQRFEVTRPTMGTGRSREDAVDTDVAFSVFAPGDDGAQQVATARAYEMASALDAHLRTRPNEALGGACYDAWVSGGELVEAKAPNPSGGVAGRVAEVTVTVTTLARR